MTASSSVQTPTQDYRDYKESGKCVPKEYSKPPVISPNEMEIWELPNKELKVIVLQMLRELQENMDKQFNDIRKWYNKNWEVLPRDKKHKNATENVELSTMTELKNSI